MTHGPRRPREPPRRRRRFLTGGSALNGAADGPQTDRQPRHGAHRAVYPCLAVAG